MKASIRKIVTVLDETHSELGRPVSPPIKRAAAVAVIANPFAGTYQDDLSELIDIGEELGDLLGRHALAALGIEGEAVQGYGKAAALWPSGTSRTTPSEPRFFEDGISAGALPRSLRRGAPSLGCRIAAACSSSPSSPTAAALP